MGVATFLNGRAPTHLRGLVWLALSDTAIIQAPTLVSDAGGGGSVTWAATGTVPARISPITKRPLTRIVGGAIDERSTHAITVPPNATVDVADRVVLIGRGTFEVTGTHDDTAPYTNVFEVMQIS